jgi:hypothetical protein
MKLTWGIVFPPPQATQCLVGEVNSVVVKAQQGLVNPWDRVCARNERSRRTRQLEICDPVACSRRRAVWVTRSHSPTLRGKYICTTLRSTVPWRIPLLRIEWPRFSLSSMLFIGVFSEQRHRCATAQRCLYVRAQRKSRRATFSSHRDEYRA